MYIVKKDHGFQKKKQSDRRTPGRAGEGGELNQGISPPKQGAIVGIPAHLIFNSDVSNKSKYTPISRCQQGRGRRKKQVSKKKTSAGEGGKKYLSGNKERSEGRILTLEKKRLKKKEGGAQRCVGGEWKIMREEEVQSLV